MVTKRLTAAWSTLTDSLLRSKNTVLLAFRTPPDLFGDTALWYYQMWPTWTSASDHIKNEVSQDNKTSYRRASATGALLYLHERQIAGRIKLSAIGIGLLVAGSGWIWLAITTPSGGASFVTISAGLFLVNALLAAPAAAHTANPWRRLGELTVGWGVTSIGLLAGDGWPPLISWFQRPPSTLQILAFATGSVALFCLLGALLARIAFSVVDLTIARRRVRKFSNVTALIYTVELIDWLSKDGNINDVQRRRWAIQMLELISQCVEIGLPSLLAMPTNRSGDAARDRFRQAAMVVRSYQILVALPESNTGSELRARLAELAMTLLTTHYHLLPTNEDASPYKPTLGRKMRRFVGDLLVAALPLAIVVGWYEFGFGLPDYLRQWLAGFAIVWLIAKILQMLDPTYSITWERVHTTLGSPRTPTDRS